MTSTATEATRTDVRWHIDASRSEIRFVAQRMGMTVRGRFPELSGTLDLDVERLEDSSVEAVVRTGSIEPAMDAMKGLLLSDAFLASADHPELRFRSERIEPDGDRYHVHGTLTFRGETREIALEARLAGIDLFGAERSARIVASGRVDHLVADERLEIELTITAVPAEAASIASSPVRTPEHLTATLGAQADAKAGPPSGGDAAEVDPMDANEPMRIVALVGSLRRGSLNRALMRAAREVAPRGVLIEPFALADVPFYDGDLEAEGDPVPVRALKAAITEADAILMVTPEYNRGLPAVAKNAIDWASRPPFDSPLGGKPVLLMGATTGRSGTKYALEQAADAFAHAQAEPFEERLGVSRAGGLVDDEGRMTDPDTHAELRRVLGAFAVQVRRSHRTHRKAA